ncbi:MAG: general secretion pathway protein GspB [Gammaproteobacteria bacterium]|nr:general secretion pathway protein GspB [Gammaproteobacteria bacterium]MCW8987706.1 general secretion pathway protein GspB [Gammaproteobacteria bacterium]MCW9032455.1 general secretion pathway protein GspB [Gammaproteobacteria bacterium]
MFKQKSIITILGLSLCCMPVFVQAQLDDPTRPPGHRLVLPGGKKAATATRFSLTSVRISKARRSAIVNERSVESGDMVNGAQVVAIYPSSVKLKKQGKIFTVRLLSQDVMKTKIR